MKAKYRYERQVVGTTLRIDGYQDNEFTSVQVYEVPIGRAGQPINDLDEIVAEGRAHRDPGDRFDPEVGEMLAMGRALENYGKKLQKRANGLVKHAEDCRERRAFLEFQAESVEFLADDDVDFEIRQWWFNPVTGKFDRA